MLHVDQTCNSLKMAKTYGRNMKEYYIINIDFEQILGSEIRVKIFECFSVKRSLYIHKIIRIKIHCVENNITCELLI